MTKKLTVCFIITLVMLFGATTCSFGQFIPNAPFKAELLKAPDFSLNDLDGKTFRLRENEGRPVLLFFGATWCAACRAEMPPIKDFYAAYSPRGLEIAYINIGEPARRVKRFVRANKLPCRALLDENENVADLYNIIGVPTFILIDKKGIIMNISHRSADIPLAKIFPEKKKGLKK